jgi:GNAT superfamily N-acetyltransferase
MRALMRLATLHLSQGFYSSEQTAAAAEYLCVPDPSLFDDQTSYVIESEGELVAVGAWSTRQKLYSGSEDQEFLVDRVIPGLDAARIRAFFVHPEKANRGLGRILYDTCEQAAVEMGFSEFELMATLPGVPFYERLGFSGMEIVEIELLDGTLLPCRPMSKSLH